MSIFAKGDRKSCTKVASVDSNPTTTDPTNFIARAKAAIASQVRLSPGVYLHFGDAAEAQAVANRDLAINAAVALVGIVVLLFLAFGNARRAMLVLLCIPFALIGGVAALVLTNGVTSISVWVVFVGAVWHRCAQCHPAADPLRAVGDG